MGLLAAVTCMREGSIMRSCWVKQHEVLYGRPSKKAALWNAPAGGVCQLRLFQKTMKSFLEPAWGCWQVQAEDCRGHADGNSHVPDQNRGDFRPHNIGACRHCLRLCHLQLWECHWSVKPHPPLFNTPPPPTQTQHGVWCWHF